MTNDDAVNLINDLMAAKLAKTDLTADTVVAGLLREAQLQGPGSSQSGRIAAWTALARHLGMFEDTVKLVVDSLDTASNEDLAERMDAAEQTLMAELGDTGERVH